MSAPDEVSSLSAEHEAASTPSPQTGLTSNQISAPKRIALDTNVIHGLRLYLSFAEKFRLAPFGTIGDNPDQVIKREYVDSRTRTTLLSGHTDLRYLIENCNSGAVVRYSPFTMFELIGGLVRGKGLLKAAQDGLPARIWSKIEEREISKWLTASDYQEVDHAIVAFGSNLKLAGVDVSEVGNDRLREIGDMARYILGHVFIDNGDCLVYTSAVLDECDELISRDEYFRTVVNLIENPKNGDDADEMAHFQAVRAHVLKVLHAVTDIDVSNPLLPVKLPVVRKPKPKP